MATTMSARAAPGARCVAGSARRGACSAVAAAAQPPRRAVVPPRAALGAGAPRPQGLPLGRASRLVTAAKTEYERLEGSLSAQGLGFAIVVGRFNDIVTRPLLEGALAALERHGGDIPATTVVWVPGSFELPIVAKRLAASGQYDAVICLGAVVRGSTTHYDAVAGAAATGVLNAGLATGVPVIFGVLTCETMEQAMDRAGGKLGNKGGEAALTAVEMANLMRALPAADDQAAAQH